MRTAHIMAGAETGGAELFYERLVSALHHQGAPILPIIRTNPARAARLAAQGLSPQQLRFGGPFDLTTRPRIARRLRAYAPGLVMAWMGRAAALTPPGDYTLVGRLGGNYDLQRFRRCDHLVANTRTLVDWIRAQGWPAPGSTTFPTSSPTWPAPPGPRCPRRRAPPSCSRSAASTPTRRSTSSCAPSRGCPAPTPSSPGTARSATG